jgi:hypothetical protein
VVLLDPKVELGWPGFPWAVSAATKVSGGVFLGASRGSPRRGFYRTNTGCDTQGLYQEFYLQFVILVMIFQKGMNLRQFQFEVDPTQTLARLCLEHRIHTRGWLWVAQHKAEDCAVAANAIGQTMTTVWHGGWVGTVPDRGSLSQKIGRERKMGGGGLGRR